MSDLNITAVLPAFNEEVNLKILVPDLVRVLEKHCGLQWEILVVDDGSKDKTFEVVSQFSKENSKIRVIQNSKNLGYGKTLVNGILNAQKDWVFITDSDLQFDVAQLSLLCDLVDQNCDVVQGYRIKRHDPQSRIIIGAIYKKIMKIIFPINVNDPECSFRLIKKSFLQDIDFKTKGAILPVELVCKLNLNGARFKEVGVEHKMRMHGVSNALNFHSALKFAREFFILFKEILLR